MNSPNRATQITKLQKVLKKHYKPVATPERTLLEHLLYACCLENAAFDKADEALAQLQQTYFDWNEVRVTSTTELGEIFHALPRPQAAAGRIKKLLQGMFDVIYDFDLEPLKKQNLGKSIKDLERFGATPFALAYVTQVGLGGHAIAADEGTFDVLVILGVITDNEAAKGLIPGIERAIPKNKGGEFFSELHQLAADFLAQPTSPKMRALLTEVASDAKERIAARLVRKDADAEQAKILARKEREAAAREAAMPTPPAKPMPAKPEAKDTKETKGKAPPAAKPVAPPPAPEKPKAAPPAAKKPVKAQEEPPRKKPAAEPPPKKKSDETGKKPGLKGLVKKKPR